MEKIPRQYLDFTIHEHEKNNNRIFHCSLKV